MIPLLKEFSDRAVDTQGEAQRTHAEGDVVGKQMDTQSWGKIALCWETASPQGPMSEQRSSKKQGSVEDNE